MNASGTGKLIGCALIAIALGATRPLAGGLAAQAPEGSVADAARMTAARLHLEAARARPADDPRTVTSLRAAALVAGPVAPEQAAEWMVTAAEHALARGDVETAAHSYVDAAVALARGGPALPAGGNARLLGLVERARALAGSPDLDGERRAPILERAATVLARADRGVLVQR